MYQDETRAYQEVYEILKLLDTNLLNKIPLEIRNTIESNRDNNHNFKINNLNELETLELLDYTKSLLILIYIEYLSNEEEKKQIEEKLLLVQQTLEKNKHNKYNTDNLFKKTELITNTSNSQITSLKEYKESLFKKIIKFLKNFFKNK